MATVTYQGALVHLRSCGFDLDNLFPQRRGLGEKSVSLLPSGIILWMILEYHRDVRRLPALLLCQAFFASKPLRGFANRSPCDFLFRCHLAPFLQIDRIGLRIQEL